MTSLVQSMPRAGLTRRMGTFWRWRITERALHRLSDHQLKDIGLHRSEIGSLTHHLGDQWTSLIRP
jgi:uncharacterized protein YjiS (DUF1127 family)